MPEIITKCPFTGVKIDDCGECVIWDGGPSFADRCPIAREYFAVMRDNLEVHTEKILSLLNKAAQS